MRSTSLAALLLLLATLFAGPAQAQTFPPFTGLVVDAANLIPDDREAALKAKLEAFQQQTGRQLVVATIADMQGYPLDEYGYRLGRAWGVGLKDVNNGVVLFVAPNEPPGQRGPRIEVGYGLEPVLTDALSSVIINQKMMPLLKQGNDVPGALETGTDAIIAQLSLPDDQAKQAQAKAVAEFDRTHARGQTGSGGGLPFGLIFWVLVAGFVLLSHRRGGAGPWGARRYRRGGSNWPVWLWAASEIARSSSRGGGGGWGGSGSSWGGGSSGGWGGGGFTGGGGGSFGGGGASGSW